MIFLRRLSTFLVLFGIMSLSCEDEVAEQQDTTLPTVTITNPQTGLIVSEIVTITCISTDNEGVDKVELWVDEDSTDVSDNTSPYSLQWNTSTYEDGSSHMITVRSYDVNNNKHDSAPIVLTVDNSSSYPSPVEILSVYYINNSIEITWTKSTNDDFSSYKLYESLSEDMADKYFVYETDDKIDTIYTKTDFDENQILYYQVAIEDSASLSTNSNILYADTHSPALIIGSVHTKGTNNPVNNATVLVSDSTLYTNESGIFTISLYPGYYPLTITHEGHMDRNSDINVEGYDEIILDTLFLYDDPWDSIGVIANIPVDLSGQFSHCFVSGYDNTIYFATHNNGGFEQFIKSYNITTGTVSDVPIGGDLCACGYGSRWVAAPNGKLYYFANGGHSFNTQTNTWQSENYPDERRRGEPGVTVLGNELIYVGGRDMTNTSQAFNIENGEWISLADYPDSTYGPALVTYDNMVYSMIGNKMHLYNRVNDQWSELSELPFNTGGDDEGKYVFIRNHHIIDFSSGYTYNFGESSWSEIYLPNKANGYSNNTFMKVSMDGDIYGIGYKDYEITIFLYNPILE